MLDIDAVIDREAMSGLQKIAVACCCAVAIVDGFDSQLIGFLAPAIASSLHVGIKSFGPMFSAGLIGLMIGALVMGPLGDRIGRKRVLISATLFFGVMGGLTGLAQSVDQLMISRFLTGLGLGGAMPNLMALATEYAPKRHRHVVIGLVSASFPTGAMISGLVASVLLDDVGWRVIFYIGGLAAIVLSLILCVVMPESVRYLSLSTSNRVRIRQIMARIWPASESLDVVFVSHNRPEAGGSSLMDLFRSGRQVTTLSLWAAFFMNLLVLYFIVSWLPGLLRTEGMPISAGAIAIAAFSFGGILGSVVQGPLMRKWAPAPALIGEYAIFVLAAALLTTLPLTPTLVNLLVFVMGVAIQGAQAGINSLSAGAYPTSIRSTGVGWCLGVGRVGSIAGPLLGGLALNQGWSVQKIFASGIVPALCASIAIAIIAATSPHRQSRQTS